MFPHFQIISTVGKVIFPSLLWNFKIKEKVLYLTFDDGPVPGITPWVLQQLKDYNAKATFFCIGDNVARHPEIFKMILNQGHVVGNHSYNHLNGWKTDRKAYLENVLKAETVISRLTPPAKHRVSEKVKKLYRPPYGKIKPSQIKDLEKHEYKIVMWDVISGDYDQNKSCDSCLRDAKYAGPGSIVVFHDSDKAYKNLRKILPEVLGYYSEKGFEFKSL